jgi:uncharacterized protein YjiS (DUF1127 family)
MPNIEAHDYRGLHPPHGCDAPDTLPQIDLIDYITVNATRRFEHAGIFKEDRTMNISRSFKNWRKYRQTVTELGRMSDRELSDLGIGRSEITSVARKAIR